ncbi:MAG: hypothetical protein AW07_01449 [Candidatus Accumulibacter sp. SK-11]|nr:MAG: hypothetical protein AW07_01449 [Candidatus Accumulibacter sp. SK-11]
MNERETCGERGLTVHCESRSGGIARHEPSASKGPVGMASSW